MELELVNAMAQVAPILETMTEEAAAELAEGYALAAAAIAVGLAAPRSVRGTPSAGSAPPPSVRSPRTGTCSSPASF